MPAVNVDMLLKPVSDASPCGEDLRYDSRFLAVLRNSETGSVVEIGKPGEPGYKRVEPEEPPWRDVRDGCLELLGLTKHLSLAVTLCLAQVRMEGYSGFRDALAVLRGLLEQRWDTLYPTLDPDDYLDPLERSNIIVTLGAQIGTPDDRFRVLERVRELVLFESPRVGKIRHKDIVAAMGEVVDVAAPVEEGGTPKQRLDLPIIDAAFLEANPEQVEQNAKTIEECLAHVDGIIAAFKRGVEADVEKLKAAGRGPSGSPAQPDLSRLKALLADAAKQLRRRQASASGGSGGGGSGGDPAASDRGGSGASGEGQQATGGGRLAGEIRGNDDVVLALDKVFQYYERYEPSSPVPLIVACARKMVGRKFLEISRVLTPSEITMLDTISKYEPSSPS
ncbi:MAG: type VI secretion system ImpA family N-terminal domain-containing protein [Planctomycetota bacterium]|nr:type VI secretion system ImpA family N-terminal domain-containing protein [Planctomycetota bacterium]